MWVGLLFALIGTPFLVGSVKSARRGLASRNWPSIPARVISSCAGFCIQRRGRIGRYKSVWYEYTHADGDPVQSNRIHCGHQALVNDPQASMFLVTSQPYLGYKPGDDVVVYVDPDDSVYTILKPGIPRSAYCGLCFGIALIVLGIGSLFE